VQAHSAQEHSFLMPAFLEAITCSAWVCPFPCAFQEEEPLAFMVVLGTST
jgi:hypothetical protein